MTEKKNVNGCLIGLDSVTIPWSLIDQCVENSRRRVDNANHPNKKLYRQGQLTVWEGLLELRDKLFEESKSELTKELEMDYNEDKDL